MSNPKNQDRSGRGRRTAAALTGAALVSTALTAAVAPAPTHPSRQLDYALAATFDNVQPAYGIGPVGGLITPLLNSMDPKMNPFDLGGLIQYNFLGGAPSARGVYDLVNNLPYQKTADLAFKNNDPCQNAQADGCRAAFVFATGFGTLGVTDAVEALIAASQGQTRMGYDPLKQYDGGTGITDVSAFYIANMFRPDGGIASRFPDITKLFGLNPNMPVTGLTPAKSPGKASIFTLTTDISWPYNPLSDFPITANPFALANTVLGWIPQPQLFEQLQTPGSVQDKLVNVLSYAAGTFYPFPTPADTTKKLVLATSAQCKLDAKPGKCVGFVPQGAESLLFGPIKGNMATGGNAAYVTLAAYNPELPLLYPDKIPSLLINPLLKQIKSPYLLGTPMADVLAPALKILVNIGYNDVVTPDTLNTPDPNTANSLGQAVTYAEEGYKAYDRTFAQPPQGDPAVPSTATPFAWFNNPALTAEETTKAYADAGTAFTDSLKAQAQKPLFGILVPNPAPPTPPTPPTAATPAAAVQPAAAVSAPVESPSAEPADVSIPALPAVDSASDPDPVDVPAAPKTTRAGAAKAGGGQSSDNDNSGGQSHRGQR